MYLVGWPSELTPEEAGQVVQRYYWVTYRHDVYPISGTAFTGDSGWGCMIRCGQMLAASALSSTLLGESIWDLF
jgi:cysteine protease ATG4